MTDEEIKEIKNRCMADLTGAMQRYDSRMKLIDERVWQYAQDCIRTDIDCHNIDELLALRKFCRMLDSYEYDYVTVHQMIQDAEGTWRDGRHIDGGLKIDGIYGYSHYRLTPLQAYSLAYIYGPKKWIDTTSPIGSREMLPTERAGENGSIEDLRRVINSFVLMWPRKVAKTFFGAFVQFEGLMRGERDYEGYICGNTAQQAGLLFKQLRNMIEQLDPKHKWFRISDTDQSRQIAWRPSTGKTALVKALTKGGDGKDGLKACTCSADEFGGARRIKNRCDMESLINVVQGSMGPRREPLTIHTSTAGLGNATPYELLIDALHDTLLKEMQTPLDGKAHQLTDDWQSGIILRPDQWETDEQTLRTERVIRKVNPNLGVTIQPDFYAKEWAAAEAQGEMKKKEVITKLYNIFQSEKVEEWIRPDEIRPLQIDRRIDQCTADDGWYVGVGMDFSLGIDLHAISYLAIRKGTGPNGADEYFADMDAWITEDALANSSISSLLQQWVDDGWLHVSPGKTLEPALPVNRIIELYEKNIYYIGFGYDANKAKMPINALTQWLIDETGDINAAKNTILPIGQTNMYYNPSVEELDYMVRNNPPMIHFSQNPMWPYEFGCVALDIDPRMENKKPIKQHAGSDACKVDNIQCLCNALSVIDRAEGTVQ